MSHKPNGGQLFWRVNVESAFSLHTFDGYSRSNSRFSKLSVLLGLIELQDCDFVRLSDGLVQVISQPRDQNIQSHDGLDNSHAMNVPLGFGLQRVVDEAHQFVHFVS